ncbi:MAG: adenosylmethionine--8-amino-7-oxononanoate transaminase [Ectothiorhodospiraceae bacterium]
MNNREMIERDLSVLWHPCSQMKDHEWLPMVPVKSGSGAWLYDFDGNRYLDAISSWWVNLFGHANPRINAAIREQLDSLEHVILAGCTHAPVVELSEQLVAMTPAPMTRCFYTDNGSSAVEVALKMSYHYWRNCGDSGRTRFIALSQSYHGETLGTLAVGDLGLYKAIYEPLLMEAITVPSPDCFHRAEGESWEAYSRRMFQPMEEALAAHAHETAAVIIEPLLQCAGGMRMYHPVYLELLREACDRYGVHLIADEIATGFGRTGTMLACDQAQISPDFLLLSKGLTAGYLPLAVVMTSDTIYEAFYDDFATMRAFMHSHSYTGNPLACRAALATLQIFREDDVLSRNRELSVHMGRAVADLADHPHVGEIRQHGMVLAMEMVQDRASHEPFDWRERRGIRVYQHALQREALMRPLGNVVYFMPPYVVTEEDIDHLGRVAIEAIDAATRD